MGNRSSGNVRRHKIKKHFKIGIVLAPWGKSYTESEASKGGRKKRQGKRRRQTKKLTVTASEHFIQYNQVLAEIRSA